VLGQFLNYRLALKAEDPEIVLCLAISIEIYNPFFARRFVQMVIQEYQVKLIVFDPVVRFVQV